MNTAIFIDTYFDIAMKIHAFCSDHSISKDDAKLYVYIYVKSVESPDGLACFSKDDCVEIDALKSLLADAFQDAIIFEEPITPQKMYEAFTTYIANSARKLERDIQLEYGIENVLRGELLNRLRLHTDNNFRNKHIDIYTKRILPGISNYNESAVKIANINYQLKMIREEKEFESWIE